MDRLIKWFTLPEEETQARLVWFTDSFVNASFQGVDAMLMQFLKYCAELGVPAKRTYLEVFLRTEGKKCIKKNNIRLDTMSPLNYDEPGSLEEAYRVIAAATLTRYDICVKTDLTDKVFKVEMKTFIQMQKTVELQKVFADTYPKLVNGSSDEDIIQDLQVLLDSIATQYDVAKLDNLDFIMGRAYTKGERNKQTFLFKTGIPCIDGDMGGFYSKQCWTFTGPPGGGKTRFAAIHFAYQAAVYYKLDVLFDELELTASEVENILIAYHIANIYGGKIKIPDNIMNRNQMSEQQSRFYESARIDLFESEGKYGKIVISTDSLEVESLKKKRLQYFKLNRKTLLWVVDYLGLLRSKPLNKFERQLAGYEIIELGIKKIKDIAKIADIGALCVCQYNDEGVKASEAGKTIMPGMVQGGHVIQRHSDYDIAMAMTLEQKLANMRTLSIIKQRSAAGFTNVPLQVDLSVSIFRQMKQQVNPLREGGGK